MARQTTEHRIIRRMDTTIWENCFEQMRYVIHEIIKTGFLLEFYNDRE